MAILFSSIFLKDKDNPIHTHKKQGTLKRLGLRPNLNQPKASRQLCRNPNFKPINTDHNWKRF